MAISSCRVDAGNCGLTMMTFGTSATDTTGVKSFTGS